MSRSWPLQDFLNRGQINSGVACPPISLLIIHAIVEGMRESAVSEGGIAPIPRLRAKLLNRKLFYGAVMAEVPCAEAIIPLCRCSRD
jgi:hypothetical protein